MTVRIIQDWGDLMIVGIEDTLTAIAAGSEGVKDIAFPNNINRRYVGSSSGVTC